MLKVARTIADIEEERSSERGTSRRGIQLSAKGRGLSRINPTSSAVNERLAGPIRRGLLWRPRVAEKIRSSDPARYYRKQRKQGRCSCAPKSAAAFSAPCAVDIKNARVPARQRPFLLSALSAEEKASLKDNLRSPKKQPQSMACCLFSFFRKIY